MYITEVKITNEWKKLEDLIAQKVSGFVFDSSKTYTIQNIDIGQIRILEKDSIPDNNLIGFIKKANEIPFYYKKTNGDLYVRSYSIDTYLTISED